MAPAAARAEVLLERADVVTGEWAPFTSERMDGSGMLASLVTEVLRGMGLEPEYRFLPFSDALDKAGEGRVLGTFPWFRNEEREQRFIYSAPILDVEYVIFFNPDGDSAVRDAERLADLKGLRTVRVAGYAYGKLDCVIDFGTEDCPGNATPAETGARVASEFRAFEKLAAGEVDYVAASRAVGESLIARAFPLEARSRFAVLERPDLQWSMSVHFLFSRNRSNAARLKAAFDAALEEVVATGRLAELRQRINWEVAGRQNLVAIGDPPDGGPIVGRASRQSPETVVLPRGTRGVVIEWSPRFRGETAVSEVVAVSQVELLNGPLRGRRVWIRDDLITLSGE